MEDIYKALRSRNNGSSWKKKNIFVFQSNGNSPNPDKRDELSQIESTQNRDFDGDGRSEVTAPATKRHLRKVFRLLKKLVKNGDQLFIFVNDHGNPEVRDTHGKVVRQHSVELWGENIQVDELRSLFESLKKKAPKLRIGIAMSQCFSGGFQALSSLKGVCVMSAAAPEEVSWAEFNSDPHMPFNRFLAQAIRENPAANMENVYDYVTRRDWHAEWNELSSQKIVKELGGISETERADITMHPFGTGKWTEQAKEISARSSLDQTFNDLQSKAKASREALGKFVTQFYETLDSFEILSDSERRQFILHCHSAWMNRVGLDEEVIAHYRGLQQNPAFPEEKKKDLEQIWEDRSQNIDLIRRLRGTCRRAQRIDEQIRTAFIRRELDTSNLNAYTLGAMSACSEFQF